MELSIIEIMATSLMKFKGKAFWIRNAVAEVWFCALLTAIKEEKIIPEWVAKMLDEINLALQHAWVDGIVMNAFDTHLNTQEKIDWVMPIALQTNMRLLSEAKTLQVVSIEKFDAASEVLIPEIQMIETLLLRPDEISAPWKSYVLPGGWCIA